MIQMGNLNMKQRTIFLTLLAMLTILAGMQISCSDKVINQPPVTSAVMTIDLSSKAHFSQGTIDNFRVVVSREQDPTDTLIDTTTVFVGDTVVMKLDSLPANEPLIFVSQVIMTSDEVAVVVYEGLSTATLVPGGITEVAINLFPVVPMVKLSPRYLEVETNQNISFELKVNGIHDLSQISFRLHWDFPAQIDFSTQVTEALSNRVVVFDTSGGFAAPPYYYACGLWNTESTTPVVDTSGYATLATISFTSPIPEILPVTMTITIDSLTMYDTARDSIDAGSVYCNQTTVVIGSDTSVVDSNSIVNFPDPILEQIIRDTTGVTTGNILLRDLLPIDTLKLDSGITDLTGLEYCTNLVFLWQDWYSYDESYVGISDISPLQYLTNLTRLQLYRNSISDISPLQNLTNLQYLGMWRTSISNIRPLQNLINLCTLQLWHAPVSDISPLQNLINLQALNLWFTSVSDISPLQNLTNLNWLSLSGTSISDISPLQNLTNLNWLSLSGTSISDISLLQNLTNLQTLYLMENSVSDISPMQYLTNLQTLDLWGNSISDIIPLQNLTNLQDVNLGYNEISDIAPLVNNSGIGSGDEVWLTGNPLDSVSVNTHIPALENRGVTVTY